jgi:hypothetical protein
MSMNSTKPGLAGVSALTLAIAGLTSIVPASANMAPGSAGALAPFSVNTSSTTAQPAATEEIAPGTKVAEVHVDSGNTHIHASAQIKAANLGVVTDRFNA